MSQLIDNRLLAKSNNFFQTLIIVYNILIVLVNIITKNYKQKIANKNAYKEID